MATISESRAAVSFPAPLHQERDAAALRTVRLLTVVVLVAAPLAALAPVGVSIATVWLFAGPHNWLECRYFLRRMPARWGAMRTYFLSGIGGAVALSAGFAALPWLAERFDFSFAQWERATAVWNVALGGWVLLLVALRQPLSPARRWPWVWPLGAALLAAAWIWPRPWSIGLVFAHPLMALWFLDREFGKFGAEAQAAYRKAAALVPIAGLLLVAYLADAPPLAGDDVLTSRIAWHAGTDVFSAVSNRCPVALHVFLETVHYAVWIALLPALALRGRPWRLADVPLAVRSTSWRRLLGGLLALGGAITVVLWVGFAVDYPLTRDIYFTAAVLHVLTEIPFLLRLL
ncbi:MAG: hypothetical protein JNL96_00230 [Planctomycetaceae bacterium]|nr:hypothetical protein [Planctomycetaceae bacterium]